MATIILVHGAWHDASCWRLVKPLLAAAGIQVHTPDLPGHGKSELPPARSTMKAYVSEIVDLVRACEEPVTLLGHSMSGMVITAVASTLPAPLHELIYLCAYLPQPGDSIFSLIPRIREHEPLAPIELAMQLGPDKRTCAVEQDQIRPLFYGAAPPKIAAEAVEHFAIQGSLPLAAALTFDRQQVESLKLRYICCQKDRVIPFHHQRRMAAQYPSCQVDLLDSDHSPFFSQPQALADLLIQALKGEQKTKV